MVDVVSQPVKRKIEDSSVSNKKPRIQEIESTLTGQKRKFEDILVSNKIPKIEGFGIKGWILPKKKKF